jgi:hypothetical protein
MTLEDQPMRRTLLVGVLSVAGLVLGTAVAGADVVVRGPFGGMIVVPAPVNLRLGSGFAIGTRAIAAQPQPGEKVGQPDIVSTPAPVVRLGTDGETLPPPKVLMPGSSSAVPVVAVLPRDFAKTFQPAPGNYEVTFLHPHSKQPVTVAFILPPGQPRVSYVGNVLRFDYGRQDVEIRFKLGGRVAVTTR